MKTLDKLKPMTADINEDTFITKIKNVTVWGAEDLEDYYAEVIVKWCFYIEYRSWGIKSLNVYSMQAQAIVYDYDTDDSVLKIDSFEMDDWTLQDEGIDIKNGASPNECSLDLKNKDITIEW